MKKRLNCSPFNSQKNRVETGDAVVYVDVKFDELKLDGLDESTSNRLYAMQEGINTILDNLAKDSNYSNL